MLEDTVKALSRLNQIPQNTSLLVGRREAFHWGILQYLRCGILSFGFGCSLGFFAHFKFCGVSFWFDFFKILDTDKLFKQYFFLLLSCHCINSIKRKE